MSTPVPSPAPNLDDLTAHVRAVLRPGLPLPDDPGIAALLQLRGVAARAVEPSDRTSRVRALDGLLRWQLARFEHPRLAEAARLLFGAAPGSGGLTLTERRAKAAASAGYEVHHFRKRIEPEICQRLASMLSTDSDEVAARVIAPRLGRSRNPLRLAADVFAWEAVEHEQALSELWSEVYALRASLLATARLASMHGTQHLETLATAEASLWHVALLRRSVLAYRAAYGAQLLGADPNTAPEDLAALVGWHPPLVQEALDELAAVAEAHPQFEDFRSKIFTTQFASTFTLWRDELSEQSTAPREHE
jgi:hypothetical protein